MPWQPAAMLFPDVETVVPAKFRALLAARDVTDVFVGRDVPDPRRPKMLTVNRDGGNFSELRDRARVRVRAWAETDADANDLAALAVALAPLMADGSPILHVEHLSGPYEIPDESGACVRYLLFQIDTEGAAL